MKKLVWQPLKLMVSMECPWRPLMRGEMKVNIIMGKDSDNYNNNRRCSIQLKGYDYSQSGLYFITICTQNRENIFGEIKSGEMVLNEYGQTAYGGWFKLPERFYIVGAPLAGALDVFVVMPNHIHEIIQITVGAPLAGALDTDAQNFSL